MPLICFLSSLFVRQWIGSMHVPYSKNIFEENYMFLEWLSPPFSHFIIFSDSWWASIFNSDEKCLILLFQLAYFYLLFSPSRILMLSITITLNFFIALITLNFPFIFGRILSLSHFSALTTLLNMSVIPLKRSFFFF